MSEQSLKTPLGRVRGLGSAKDGAHHWWMQRLTGIAMVPLGIWLAFSLASLSGAGWQEVVAWLSSPLAALAMILFVTVGFWHLKLGIQVVVEDYVHSEGTKVAVLIVNTFACIFLGAAADLAVLKLMIGG
jgi:succinate dehydrogenase / fumarate reductase membrane anchor subunit